MDFIRKYIFLIGLDETRDWVARLGSRHYHIELKRAKLSHFHLLLNNPVFSVCWDGKTVWGWIHILSWQVGVNQHGFYATQL